MNKKIRIRTNLVTGIVMGIVSIVFLLLVPIQIGEPGWVQPGSLSPRAIPTIVLSGILLCSVILIIQSLVFKKEDIYEFEVKKELITLAILGMILTFAFIVTNFGFWPAIIIFFPSILLFMGERKPLVYIVTVALGFGIYFLFIRVFMVPLPSWSWFGG